MSKRIHVPLPVDERPKKKENPIETIYLQLIALEKKNEHSKITDQLKKLEINPLMKLCVMCIGNGKKVLVKTILDFGKFDSTQFEFLRAKALYLASRKGHTDIVTLLLKFGMSPNGESTISHHYASPLYIACRNGNYEIVKILLESGAQIMQKNISGCTPFYAASSQGHFKIMKLLLKHGAEAAPRQNYDDLNCLEIACLHGHLDIVIWLLEIYHRDPKYVLSQNQLSDLLLLSCSQAHFGVAKYLIGIGASPISADRITLTSTFHKAAESGSVQILKFLTPHFDDISISDMYGWNALHYAAWKGKTAAGKCLIDWGVNTNARTIEGVTALHLCSFEDSFELARYLIQNGASPNNIDNQGLAPLHRSAEWGALKTTETLLTNGANPDCSTAREFYMTPLMLACQKDNTEIAKLLIEHGADVNFPWKMNATTPLALACMNHCLELVKVLLDAGADPNLTAQPYGAYPIVIAARLDSIRILQLLIVAGASTKITTPLKSLANFAHFHGETAIGVFLSYFDSRMMVIKRIFQWCRVISTNKPNYAKIQILRLICVVFMDRLFNLAETQQLLKLFMDRNGLVPFKLIPPTISEFLEFMFKDEQRTKELEEQGRIHKQMLADAPPLY